MPDRAIGSSTRPRGGVESGSLQREGEGERRLAAGTLGPDPAAVRLDQAFGDGESQSQAGDRALSGDPRAVEAGEEVRELAGGDPRAPVGHRDLDRVGLARVVVADTGPGIDPEIAGQLFQPFITTKRTGMGVGLSISRGLVEAHGGRIWAEPRPEGGTRVSFTLPVPA